MSIFSDIDDSRPDWWDMASCNTRTGELAGLFFPSLPERAPVEPHPDADADAWAAYGRAVDDFSESLTVMKAETEKAMGICAECPLTGTYGVCYSAAVARGEPAGIWGGVLFTPTKVRRARAKVRALQAAAA